MAIAPSSRNENQILLVKSDPNPLSPIAIKLRIKSVGIDKNPPPPFGHPLPFSRFE